MKSLISAIALAIITCGSANAALTVGMDGGIAGTSNIQGSAFSDEKETDFGFKIYGEYTEEHLGMGVAYNNFSNIDVQGNTISGSVQIQGLEVYGKVAYRFDNLEPYAKLGMMYAMSNGSTEIENDNNFTPTLGIGARYYITENLGINAGYDRYWDAYDTDNGKFDIDFYHVGLSYNF